jgi:hypothetical protein
MVIVYSVVGILIVFGLAAGYLYLSEQKSSLREDVSRSREKVFGKQRELEDLKTFDSE